VRRFDRDSLSETISFDLILEAHLTETEDEDESEAGET